MTAATTEFRDLLLEEARAEGFPVAATIDLIPALSALQEHIARYDSWIEAGNAGAMDYLKRGRDRRADPRLVMPGALSMLCVLVPYTRRPLGAKDPSQGPRYARYLQGRDYHKLIPERLERVMQRVRDRSGDSALEYKICVDTSAVLERSWAALAGLGWIGKNTLLIHPQLGSYHFLAEVLINRETGEAPQPINDYCGNCTRCLQACPTGAFTAPHSLDSRQCISYRTLEHRGPLTDNLPHKNWIAGCDICQEVCPFNTKAAKGPEVEDTLPDATQLTSWQELDGETEEQYRDRVKDSSLKRVKHEQMRRNITLSQNPRIESQK